MNTIFKVAGLTSAMALAACGADDAKSTVSAEVKPATNAATSAEAPKATEQAKPAKATYPPYDHTVTKEYQEGVHYLTLPEPMQIRLKEDQVAIVWEFFQYTCGHCYNLHPTINSWKSSVADDVKVELMPVWRIDPYARAYWAAEFLKLDPGFHDAVYAAIHQQKKSMSSMKDFSKLAELYGADAARFETTAASFAVDAKISQADEASKLAAGVVERFGTPAMMVNGKYVITGSTANAGQPGSNEEMLKVADFLVEKARQEKAAAAQ